jgi:phenylalanine-4-hydroxylase
MQDGQVRDFGAGILSSPGETRFSIENQESNRILIDPADDYDLLRLAATDYLISEYQKTYFVMKSFDSLSTLKSQRIVDASKNALRLPHYTWREIVPGDCVINVGTVATSPNEKYYGLMTGLSSDECLRRTAVRNLRMFAAGMDDSLLTQFKVPPPPIPSGILDWFVKADSRGDFQDTT